MDSEIAIIRNKIIVLRNQQVMIDRDIAELYGVETKRLNEQVKRNIERFPEEFCFQLSDSEIESLRSQFATLKIQSEQTSLRGKHSKYRSYYRTGHTELQCAIPIASSKLHHNNPRPFFDNRQ